MSTRPLRDVVSLAVRRTVAQLALTSGVIERRLARRRGAVAILAYHRVVEDDADVSGLEPGMYVRASTLDRHLAWIGRRGSFRTLGEVVSKPPAPLAPPEFVLTFDDGWKDNLTVGLPIFERHGARATIFVVRDQGLSAQDGQGDFLSLDEMRHLSERGFEIGAHTVSHPRLPDLDDDAVEREMRMSRDAVEAWIGKPCRVFAYPYGAHRDRTVEIARRVFEASVIGGGGWWSPGDDLSRMPRIGIHQDMTSTGALFAARLAL